MDVIDTRPLLVGGALFEHPEGHLHPSDRGAQLVRDVSEEALLAIDEPFEPLRHEVDRSAELADLIAAGLGDERVKVSLRRPRWVASRIFASESGQARARRGARTARTARTMAMLTSDQRAWVGERDRCRQGVSSRRARWPEAAERGSGGRWIWTGSQDLRQCPEVAG